MQFGQNLLISNKSSVVSSKNSSCNALSVSSLVINSDKMLLVHPLVLSSYLHHCLPSAHLLANIPSCISFYCVMSFNVPQIFIMSRFLLMSLALFLFFPRLYRPLYLVVCVSKKDVLFACISTCSEPYFAFLVLCPRFCIFRSVEC